MFCHICKSIRYRICRRDQHKRGRFRAQGIIERADPAGYLFVPQRIMPLHKLSHGESRKLPATCAPRGDNVKLRKLAGGT